MKIVNYILTISITVILLNSCSFENLDEPTKVADFESEINLELFQDLQNHEFYLWNISTSNDNLCEESELKTTIQETNSGYTLYIDGLSTPVNCSTGSFDISSSERFKLKTKEMDMNIVIANIFNNAKITPEDDKVVVNFGTTEGIISHSTELLKMKPNYFWAGISSTKNQDIQLFYDLYGQITRDLKYIPLENGNYGYFVVNDDVTVVNPITFDKYDNGFVLSTPSDIDIDETILSEVVTNFRMSHPEIDFFLCDGLGKLY